MARTELRFLLNDAEVTLAEAGPGDSLLDFLRLDRGLRGAKEGCAEGDCGACTVLVGRLREGALRYGVVNSCIRMLPSLDGCHVVTVEHLARDGLHPVQQAMVDFHGSQCGFCTPGIVMALYALWLERPRPEEAEVRRALQGNLCRCTGYAPILRAAAAAADYGLPEDDPLTRNRTALAERLAALADGKRVEVARGGRRALLPADMDDLAALLPAEPEATVVAGATDVGVWINKALRDIAPAVFVGHLDALARISESGDAVEIGAAASYSEAEAALLALAPALGDYWSRIGGWQIRNMGTVGGNIANGSPIADLPPALIALGAELVLRKGPARRRLPLEDYFLDYGRQDLAPGEFVEAVRVPRPPPEARLGFYKVSKRRDEDISSVCAGFMVRVEGGRIREARLAYGGMAAIPKRAPAAEAALLGQPWGEAALEAAGEALERDFTPISDWRASAPYRALVARNLLRRFHGEQSAAAS